MRHRTRVTRSSIFLAVSLVVIGPAALASTRVLADDVVPGADQPLDAPGSDQIEANTAVASDDAETGTAAERPTTSSTPPSSSPPVDQTAQAAELADRTATRSEAPATSADPDETAAASDARHAASGDVDAGEPGDATTAPAAADQGLRATTFDGVYAQGVPVWVAMSATREIESGDDYLAEAKGSSASGAYQVIDSTWNGYGGYARAAHAPAAVQDQFAFESMVSILRRHGDDVSMIPLAWYYPSAITDPALMGVVPRPDAGNVLTPREYQVRWMAAFHRHLEAGSPVFLPADSHPLIPAIAFPVLGPTSFVDDWHFDRDGGERRHEGLDLLGQTGQPLRAAFDGVVTRLRADDEGNAGVGITITRVDGLRANYFHLDNELRWHPDLDVGDAVKAGQVIAFMGATGNAGIPHLHFELRTPDGEPFAPYPAVLEAVQREQCSVGIGPWSTAFRATEVDPTRRTAERIAADLGAPTALPTRRERRHDDAGDLSASAALDVDDPLVVEIEGPDGARWSISVTGAVRASGSGAMIAPSQGDCRTVPEGEFGTDAGGVGIDTLPEHWWDDDVDVGELVDLIAAAELDELPGDTR